MTSRSDWTASRWLFDDEKVVCDAGVMLVAALRAAPTRERRDEGAEPSDDGLDGDEQRHRSPLATNADNVDREAGRAGRTRETPTKTRQPEPQPESA